LTGPRKIQTKRGDRMKAVEGCPGSQILDFIDKDRKDTGEPEGKIESQLRQWPIQMYLISPTAP